MTPTERQLAEAGLATADRHTAEVVALARRSGVRRCPAHRGEDPAKPARIADLAGVEALRPALPLELLLRAGPVARTVVSFPSTVVHTLPIAPAGTGAEVLVHEPAGDWLVPGAPERAAGFLAEVTATTRARHRMGTVR
ncbi:hypothetical protein [Streptomyces sp. NPDC001070]